ncbi:MAG: hypothetical protein RIR48_378 [Bacteroidota bacterium]
MPSKPIIDKPDYSLAIRYRKRDGQWSQWMDRGYGKFESIEIIQLQIRTLASAYPKKEKEVRFEKDGVLCDFMGNASGKVIELR